MFLPSTYFPDHKDNKMASEGDLELARKRFIENRPNNLNFLLETRYQWMNHYIDGKKVVYELGAGAGFSKIFIDNENLKLTDIHNNSWVDEQVDALSLPFEDESVDVFLCSHMIHHVAQPSLFLKSLGKKLKKGGLIVISEIHTSWTMRFLLWLMKHEGWSYDVDIFNEDVIANDPKDPWSANCAIPELLWKSNSEFESHHEGLEVILNQKCEFLVFPLSGGVIAKSKTINLPRFILKTVNQLDKILTRLCPNFFAMGMKVVIQKN